MNFELFNLCLQECVTSATNIFTVICAIPAIVFTVAVAAVIVFCSYCHHLCYQFCSWRLLKK